MAKGKKTGGRVKGTPNKSTQALKDAILAAAAAAAPDGNLQTYLTARAQDDNKGPFMGLLGKVLPMQHEGGNPDNPIQHKLRIEFVRPAGNE